MGFLFAGKVTPKAAFARILFSAKFCIQSQIHRAEFPKI
jgi:hypothetical protein